MKRSSSDKKTSLKMAIEKEIDKKLNTAIENDSIDYFDIEIKNHGGTLNIVCTLKNRKEVY